MPSWSGFWQQVVSGSVRQAWGLAAEGQGWVLMGLSSYKSVGVRVHATQRIDRPEAGTGGMGFGQGLSRVGGRSRQRVSVALAENDMVSGVLELPAQLSRDNWPSEVQLEVAQLLGLPPDEVSFDFQSDPASEGLLSRVRWVGCDQALVRAIRADVRAAGWQLDSVEPALHAAHRAACHLIGGLSSLLTQATQDWQFDLKAPDESVEAASSRGADLTPGQQLVQALQSPAGPRLVASGLALKAWL